MSEPARMYHPVENAADNLQMKLTTLKRKVNGWRTPEEYEATLKFMHSELQDAWDALERTLKEASTE